MVRMRRSLAEERWQPILPGLIVMLPSRSSRRQRKDRARDEVGRGLLGASILTRVQSRSDVSGPKHPLGPWRGELSGGRPQIIILRRDANLDSGESSENPEVLIDLGFSKMRKSRLAFFILLKHSMFYFRCLYSVKLSVLLVILVNGKCLILLDL